MRRGEGGGGREGGIYSLHRDPGHRACCLQT